MSVSTSNSSSCWFSDTLRLPLSDSLTSWSPAKFYALSSRTVHYRVDPPIYRLALIKRNVHVVRGARHSAVQCDLLVARHHKLLREIVGRQRHHVAESALNAIAVVQEELCLLAQNM